ncbi:MAG: SIR2 family protein [Patescibacteria group bacterium]|jgi:hypothetical protein
MGTHNLVLLTGAGFSKNFGGFLAAEMWSHIFNHPLTKRHAELRKLLMADQDYESVYTLVMTGNGFSPECRNDFNIVVEQAYKALDDTLRKWQFTGELNQVNTYGIGKLLSLFNSPHDRCYFFTLNQDLFMERWWGYRAPSVRWFPEQFYSLHGAELEHKDFIKLPSSMDEKTVNEAIALHSGLTYIKIHGSYGWLSSDGKNLMVIGKDKTIAISAEPVLRRYFDIFKKVMSEGQKKLLIIGYGFGDSHINQVIADAVRNRGLKVCIVSTSPYKDLYSRIEQNYPDALDILDIGLDGYFPYSLAQVFPGDQSETVYFEEIKRNLSGI